MERNNFLHQEDLDKILQNQLEWDLLDHRAVLVTGATGMVGTFLIDVLMKRNKVWGSKIQVYAMSRSAQKLKTIFRQYQDEKCFHMIEQDMTAPFIAFNEKIDYAIHAASNTHPIEYASDPIGTITSNLFGMYNLLEYAKNVKTCRIVVLSSVEIYGECSYETEWFDEKSCGYLDCNTLRSGYPESKRLSESLLQAYIAQEGVDGVVIRLCRLFGATMNLDDSKAVSQFILDAVNKRDIVLKSDGNQYYSYLYVADAVSAILYVMLRGKCGEAYNAASDKANIHLNEIANYLADMVNRKVIYDIPKQMEQAGYSKATKALLNAHKLEQLGWRAVYSVKEGLRRTVAILGEEAHSDKD